MYELGRISILQLKNAIESNKFSGYYVLLSYFSVESSNKKCQNSVTIFP